MLGFNATGFFNLCESILGEDKFMNKNWKALDGETHIKIGELLRKYSWALSDFYNSIMIFSFQNISS